MFAALGQRGGIAKAAVEDSGKSEGRLVRLPDVQGWAGAGEELRAMPRAPGKGTEMPRGGDGRRDGGRGGRRCARRTGVRTDRESGLRCVLYRLHLPVSPWKCTAG